MNNNLIVSASCHDENQVEVIEINYAELYVISKSIQNDKTTKNKIYFSAYGCPYFIKNKLYYYLDTSSLQFNDYYRNKKV